MNLSNSTEQLKSFGESVVGYISRYRTIIVAILASGAIFAAVVQTQSYLNPPRDEQTYSEIKAQVNVRSIDEETLIKLEATQSDRDDNVSSDFVPGRDNPFNE